MIFQTFESFRAFNYIILPAVPTRNFCLFLVSLDYEDFEFATVVLRNLPARYTRKQLSKLRFWDYPGTAASNLTYPFVPFWSGYPKTKR